MVSSATSVPLNRTQAVSVGSTAVVELAVAVLEFSPTSFQPVASSASPPLGAFVMAIVSVPLVRVRVPFWYVQLGEEARKAASQASCAIRASSQAIIVDASCGALSTPPVMVYCPNMLLHPALADSAPLSKVSVMVEPGTMVCAPVTSVATNVMPSNWATPDAADPELAEPLADPPADDGLADVDAAELL